MLEESLELALRFKLFEAEIACVFRKCLGELNFAPADSCSSSASLSELEFDVGGGDDMVLDACLALVVDFGALSESSVSESEPLTLLLLLSLLLLVSFFTGALATASSSLALASAFFDLFVFFADLVSELSPASLLLVVSSMTVLSWYTLYHSLKTFTRFGNPFGRGTSSCTFQSSNFFRASSWRV